MVALQNSLSVASFGDKLICGQANSPFCEGEGSKLAVYREVIEFAPVAQSG